MISFFLFIYVCPVVFTWYADRNLRRMGRNLINIAKLNKNNNNMVIDEHVNRLMFNRFECGNGHRKMRHSNEELERTGPPCFSCLIKLFCFVFFCILFLSFSLSSRLIPTNCVGSLIVLDWRLASIERRRWNECVQLGRAAAAAEGQRWTRRDGGGERDKCRGRSSLGPGTDLRENCFRWIYHLFFCCYFWARKFVSLECLICRRRIDTVVSARIEIRFKAGAEPNREFLQVPPPTGWMVRRSRPSQRTTVWNLQTGVKTIGFSPLIDQHNSTTQLTIFLFVCFFLV